ncbi:MAG: hypothetical protein A2622_02060 [Bdellovibrionales bacterium RIFCSPHIGHO2_01_FULL_40_29]|nr:MAG: hypothetical protein A2622_02060 [Bdellovibrionales bacterium RIFCSPHIGHO2_01_FULL_40_29]OFZ33872.1 MAG: hypothetical protein A3D17_02480 [Bdellovibrionales bacterium RIFCSPHIGHO2_02_FULL_40_15]
MAQVKIRFVNFDRSTALETYTEKHVENLLRRIETRHGDSKSIEVQFRLDNRASLGTIKNSEVMISYRYPGIKKILHIKKQGSDLRKVLVEAIRATEGMIQRASEKSEGGRRKLGKSKHSVRELREIHEAV